MADVDITYHEAKFTEMLLYVAGDLVSDPSGGATKLNKVLYFIDFAHTRRHGQPVSGAEYQKLRQGPAPRRLKQVRSQLVADGAAEILHDDFLGYEMHRLMPLREADTSVFSSTELATIDKVLADLAHLTNTQISDLSHGEPWWEVFDEGDTVPYHAAFMPKRDTVTPTARRMAESVAQRYGIVVER